MQKKKIQIDDVIDMAKQVLVASGKHSPQLIIEDKQGALHIVVMQFDTKTRDLTVRQIREMVYRLDSERYFVIMEAWMSIIDAKKKLIRAPRYDVDRKEILMISEYRKDMDNKAIGFPFHREKGEIIFDEPMGMGRDKITEIASLWNAFVELEGVEERMQKGMEEAKEQFFESVAKQIFEKFKPRLEKAKTKEDRAKILKEIFQEADKTMTEQKNSMLVNEDE